MDEEPQVRGCYNITFICTPTNQEIVWALPWDEHMNIGRNSKQTTCLCRDTGGKRTLPVQHTTFNTLDNWGHKTHTQSKRKRTGKKGLKGHGPEHVRNTLGYSLKQKKQGKCKTNKEDLKQTKAQVSSSFTIYNLTVPDTIQSTAHKNKPKYSIT